MRTHTLARVLLFALAMSVAMALANAQSNDDQSGSATTPSSSATQAPTSSSSSAQPPGLGGAAAASTYVSPRAQSSGNEGGVTFYEFYGGSVTSAGYITDLETTVGYNFNQHFGFDVGVPVYFTGVTANHPLRTPEGQPVPFSFSFTGLGNVYLDLMYTRLNSTLSYLGSVRLGAPTGSVRDGISTGHVTFDWDNYFDHDFGRLRPYVDVGLANSILDTHFLYRPFTTYGYVVPSEAGASVEVISPLRVGASFYDDAPIGTQTILRRPGGRELHGPSRIDRDDGASLWTTIRMTRLASLELGYDRSFRFDLNSFSFGVLFDVAGTFRRIRALH